MAPIFTVLPAHRTPLGVLSEANQHTALPLLRQDMVNGPYSPYARHLFAQFAAKMDRKLWAPKAMVVSPVRKSSLINVVFSLPLRVGSYVLQQPWTNEPDWFEAANVETEEKFLCKVLPTGDSRGAEVALAHSRLAECDSVNSVKEVLQQGLTRKVVEDVAETQIQPGELAFDFVFYPFIDYRDCLHTFVQARKVLSEEEARKLFRQICDIVGACHRAGVAVRDLKMRRLAWKPHSNQSELMLSSLENCAVLDVNGGDESICENHASPSYVSPEMCRRDGLDKSLSLCKVDIWCLGVILFAMVMGRYPFYDPDTRRMMMKVAAARLGPLPSHFSPELTELLQILLHIEPQARPDVAAVLEHPWLRMSGMGPSRCGSGDSLEQGCRCVPEKRR